MSVKILLANPPGPWLRCRWDIKFGEGKNRYFPYPVRLAYATSLLKKNNYETHLIDATAEELTREQFIEIFKKIDPDLVVWETVASSFDYDIETMKILKKIKPKTLIGVSGYHASAAFKECVESGYDFAIVGECEYSILELAQWIDKKIKKFPPGVFMKGHKFKVRELIKNIDELPWPERDSLPMKKYNDPKLKGFNVVLISSRGCPWGCSFCTVPVYYGRPNYRMRDPKDVVAEMKYLWEKYKPDELYFDDDNFAVNEKHVIDICEEIKKQNLKIKWNCMIDASVKLDLLVKMKEAGCSGITIGGESADDNVLKHLGKPVKRKNIEEMVKFAEKIGLRTHVCWVLGLPYSSKESDKETIDFAINLPSTTLQFSICTPFYGTKMQKWCEENNYFAVKDWKNFIANQKCVINYPNYSKEEIEELYSYARRAWRIKMLKSPKAIFLHWYNIYKYKGLLEIPRSSLRTLKSIFFKGSY